MVEKNLGNAPAADLRGACESDGKLTLGAIRTCKSFVVTFRCSGVSHGQSQFETKVVLAYSGGLDTSIIVRWLADRGFEVICFCANVGQEEKYTDLKKKAVNSGGKKCIIRDLTAEFVSDFVYPAISWNARYEGRYLLGTSLARPVIAKHMVEIAKAEGAEYIAHGATGKGNDQIRFELTAYALLPGVKIIAPWRDTEFNSIIKGRKEAIEYA